jgi:uncharacterized membrane protein YkgB
MAIRTRLRVALVIVPVWIGGMKFVHYEANSPVPLAANSHVMTLLYHRPADYRPYMNEEAELNLQDREWQQRNGTYDFSHWWGADSARTALRRQMRGDR